MNEKHLLQFVSAKPLVYLWHSRNRSRIIPGSVSRRSIDVRVPNIDNVAITTIIIQQAIRCCWCQTFCGLRNKTTGEAAAASTVAAASGQPPIIKPTRSREREVSVN
jgi:hypothetical protein